MKFVKVTNARNEVLLSRVKWCDTFASRLRGLTFRGRLAPDEGLILVEARAGIASTSIHMFFVRFDIAAVWLNDDRRAVHTALARAGRPYYASPIPARYVLEGPPALLDRVAVGDRLNFEE
jgi:uncharacterized membrane protein (UPF0127 family)